MPSLACYGQIVSDKPTYSWNAKPQARPLPLAGNSERRGGPEGVLILVFIFFLVFLAIWIVTNGSSASEKCNEEWFTCATKCEQGATLDDQRNCNRICDEARSACERVVR
jgi:hypothetical protein